MTFPWLRAAAFLLIGIPSLIYRFRKGKKAFLPPGPSRLPLVGNAFSIPNHYPQKYYKRLGDQLGLYQKNLTLKPDLFSTFSMLGSKIIYFEVFGQPIVVLNSAQAGKDLLDKRSSTYSNR